MLMDIPSRLLVPPTMTRRGRLGMVLRSPLQTSTSIDVLDDLPIEAIST